MRPDPVHVAAVEDTARLLADLGHDVREVDPHYPDPTAAFVPQFFAGIRTEADRGRALRPPRAADPPDLPDGRLGPPARGRAGAGGRPRRCRAKANRVFDDVDVLLTPAIAHRPPRVGRLDGVGTVGASLRAMPAIAYAALWNVAGNPAASVPCGLAADGLPLAVQLVGRTDDEATLFSLSAQLEQARPWPLVAG